MDFTSPYFDLVGQRPRASSNPFPVVRSPCRPEDHPQRPGGRRSKRKIIGAREIDTARAPSHRMYIHHMCVYICIYIYMYIIYMYIITFTRSPLEIRPSESRCNVMLHCNIKWRLDVNCTDRCDERNALRNFQLQITGNNIKRKKYNISD